MTRCFCGLSIGASLLIAVVSCRNTDAPRATHPSGTTSAPATSPTAAIAAVPADWRRLGFTYPPASAQRAVEDVPRLNHDCIACHSSTDSGTMHSTGINLACVDCHGRNTEFAGIPIPRGRNPKPTDPDFSTIMWSHHVHPKRPELWQSSANPRTVGAATLEESPDFIRFVNPGDLRAAIVACAPCHNEGNGDIVDHVNKSMMTHGAMLWSAALYNNGSINSKRPVYGEFYTQDPRSKQTVAAAVVPATRPTAEQTRTQGILPLLWPLPRWEITQPGNVLRVFERGGRLRPVLGIPNVGDDPGRPDVKLSVRGFGTDVRTDPVFIGLQKTRLLDPTLNLFGSNDHPGDYRASGCSACHVVYANDRNPLHSAMWADFGNRGHSRTKDPTIATQPSDQRRSPFQSGHPIEHKFARNMPSSTCIVCHIHPGTNVVNSFLGYQWWDNETDGEFMYPRRQRYPSSDEEYEAYQRNPEGASVRGLWSNLYPEAVSHAGLQAGADFLENIKDLNPRLNHTQFADFHGHGWIFRAVFKQDARGVLQDVYGNPIHNPAGPVLEKATKHIWEAGPPEKGVPVHLKDIHLEMGMQCVDCHFATDMHSNGKLYGETRNAVTIECIDCHGTVEKRARIFDYLDYGSVKPEPKEDPDFPDPNVKLQIRQWNAERERLLPGIFSGNEARDPDSETLKRWQRLLSDRFKVEAARLVQYSAMWKENRDGAASVKIPEKWTVVQTGETVKKDVAAWTGGSSFRNIAPAEFTNDHAKMARYAHTVRADGTTWGMLRDAKDPHSRPDLPLAHGGNMSCYACHTSWNTSCFGCHLPQRANQRRSMLHNEGAITRNYTNYNYQTLRDDVYMLGIDSTVKGNRIVPVRSACAVLVSSQDANRQWVYTQQQTVSAEGFAGTAFSPYFPHTVRAVETKTCTACHLSSKNDNNAAMAQLLLQGTNAVNFIGRFAWVGCLDKGLTAVAVTERDEPQAVIGSRLHELAYPDFAAKHAAAGGELTEAYHHDGNVLDLQLRGEYLYAACGPRGFVAYDVANIDNKGFSERIITAPVSPLGQKFSVKTRFATSVCSPSTMAIDPTRRQSPENEEGSVHPLYAYLYVTDREEGLVVIGNRPDDQRTGAGVATLLDGDPTNNFLRRAATFNPDGLLTGARHMALWGTKALISCNAGLVIVELKDPLHPKVLNINTSSLVRHPRRTAVQFRYAFVCDDDGVKVIDLLELFGIAAPEQPPGAPARATPTPLKAFVKIADARDLYISRSWGYVAAGRQGLVVLDLTNPTLPRFDAMYETQPGGGSDACAVRVGMTNSSLFAYVADGGNGLKVFQLTSANDTPGYLGFATRPRPRLIARHRTAGPAVALSEGLDRDRAVDEEGNQLSVFGRRGARPFNFQEQLKLYRNARTGRVYTVSDTPADAAELAPAPPTTAPAEALPTAAPAQPPADSLDELPRPR